MPIFSSSNEAVKMDKRGPFRVSYHGSSTIIVDRYGRWATGQVRRETAEQLARQMTEAEASSDPRV